MYSRIRQALQTVAARQRLALVLAWQATVQPLYPQQQAQGYSLGHLDPACLAQALRHPLVRLAIWVRHQRLRLLARMAFRKST